MKRFMPVDIHRKEFKRAIRGYHVGQVNEFLDLVVRDYKDLLKENEQLKALMNQASSSRRMAAIEQGRKDRLTPHDIHMKEFKRAFRGTMWMK
jgi:DivIVA domain-containing protein